jgi:hypothetical protein
MATAVEGTNVRQPPTALAPMTNRPAVTGASPAAPAELAGDSEAYWGEAILLKASVFCFLVMWTMHLYDFLAALWGK